MLTIHNDAELEAILPLIKQNKKGRIKTTHIGLRKDGGDWKWLDWGQKKFSGELEDLTWTETGPGLKGKRCAQMFEDENGEMKLKGIKCSSKKAKRSYICKENNYKYVDKWMSWDKAEQYC